MPPSPLLPSSSSSSAKPSDLPTPPRPSRGVKRRLPPDLTPLVERSLSFKSPANGSPRDFRRGSASTNDIASSSGQSAAVSVSPDKRNRKRGSRIVSDAGNGAEVPSSEPDAALDESQKRTAELFNGWREEYFEIVEQLPLEMHRSYSLIRELEGQVRAHIETIRRETVAYRDYRMARQERQMAATRAETSTNVPGTEKSVAVSGGLPDRSAENHKAGSSGDAVTPEDSSLDSSGTTKAFSSAQDSHSAISTPPPIRPIASSSGVQKGTDLIQAQATGQASAPATTPPVLYKRHPSLAHVSRACSSAVAASEEKVGLALAVYQLIDRQCRRLDADLAKAAGSGSGTGEGPAELEEGVRSGTMESRKSQKLGGGAVAGSGEQEGGVAEVTNRSSRSAVNPRNGKASSSASAQNSGGAEPSSSGAGLANTTASAGSGTDHLLANARDDGIPNMAVDPNEPVYCYCRGPSHGLMVGCDNDECPYEWFHLSCLGMTEPPADNRQWFCQDCSQAKSGGSGGSGGGAGGRAGVPPAAIKAGRKSGGRKSQGAGVAANGKKK